MVKNLDNVIYGTSESQALDIYRPVRPNGAALLWIHGGGWADANSNPTSLASEESSGFQPLVPALYRLGWTVLSVRYRGTDEAAFPAQLSDVKTAIRWAKVHAAEFGFDACIGGARRDEEKARAKERVFSFRDEWGQWDPKNQRPELWSLYNARVAKGENMRVFPISNWTELDVWQYIARERLEVPSIYYAHKRPVVRRGGVLAPITDITPAKPGEVVEEISVRFRTVGDITCTAPVESTAADNDAILAETVTATLTERGATRMDDQTSEASMEQRKKEGYF